MREIDRDLRLRAQCLQDDVASIALLGLFLRDLAGFHETLHQRLILRQLDRASVPDDVCATVSNLCDIHMIIEQAGNRGGGPHSAMFGVLPRILVYPFIRFSRRVAQRSRKDIRVHLRRAAPLLAQDLEDRLPRHAAGQLPRCGTTHAISDQKERPVLSGTQLARRVRLELQRLRAFQFGNEEGVFVVIAGVTDIVQGEYTNDDIRLLTGLVAV